MGAKPGYHATATPQRVLDILADGKPRNVREIAIELRRTSPVIDPYGAAANALFNLHDNGHVKRERVNRRFVYWREIAA